MVVCIDGNKRIAYLEKIKDDGNVVVIKFDGERLDTQYTVFISFPVGLNRPMIRVDKSSLIEALRDVVKEYLSV
ncbi:hypothetical protein SAMN04488524_2548 [Pedobacter africanus]|uniref:Uncharacterized protein n=2 Tax=Pedobacter africanus TaxID=151894 RepID=A0A1W2BQ59_9SPHI|nr:hypothetical protein SAMN04488524_2548 [Pedobacter africanus]